MKAPLQFLAAILFVGLMLLPSRQASASSTLLLSTPAHLEASAAVFRGTVVGLECFKDEAGLFHTKVSLRVDEAFKGKLPGVVLVVQRGGQVGDYGEVCGLSPRLEAGEEYLVFVTQGADGKLHCTQGAASAMRLTRPALGVEYDASTQALLNEVRSLTAQNQNAGSDVTDQVGATAITPEATTGMLGNVNSRFLQPDRGEPIPVLVDADSLPLGISLTQATNAVLQALNAWSAVTSLQFKLESIGGFGQGADTITSSDEKLRIQLHDNYGRINTANVLGIGGRAYTTSPSPSGWDLGGNVAGNEFRRSTYGYVILESGNASLQNPVTFAEVLCHEIGHALNMKHSSENPGEADTTLKEAMMYYQAHADGRGATLGVYDPPIIRQCYPANTAPFISAPPLPLHRVIDATTASSALNLAGINEVEIRGYDLQTATLTVVTNDQDDFVGSFSLVGNKVKYNAPIGNYSDSDRLDPHVEPDFPYSYYALIYARLSDGTNASSYTILRVISLRRDGAAPLDGIPDYWMQNFFGHTTPTANDLSRATDDADGDRLTNLQEYITGMNPKASGSLQRITSFTPGTLTFQAKAYELYEVMGSTNLTTWTLVKPFFPTNASLAVRTSLPQTNIIATVSNLPTANPHLFFRVRKVP